MRIVRAELCRPGKTLLQPAYCPVISMLRLSSFSIPHLPHYTTDIEGPYPGSSLRPKNDKPCEKKAF